MITLMLYGYFWFSINTIGAILHAPHLHSFPVFRTNKYHFIGIPSTDLLKHQYIQQLLKINENFIPKNIPSPSYPIVNETNKMQIVLPQTTNNFYSRGKRQEVRRFPAYPTSHYFPHYMKTPVRSPHMYAESGLNPYIFNMNPVVKENPILHKNNMGNHRPLLRITTPNHVKSSPVPIVTSKYPLKLESNLKRHVNLSLTDTEYISPYLCRNNSQPNFRSLENSLSFKPVGNLNLIETKNNYENIIYENNPNGWTPKIQSYATLYPILEYKSHIAEQKPLILENKPILEYKVPIPKYSLKDPLNSNNENEFLKNTNNLTKQTYQAIESKETNLNQNSKQNSDFNNKNFLNLNTKLESFNESGIKAKDAIKPNEKIYNKDSKLIDLNERITNNKDFPKHKFSVQNFEEKDIANNNFLPFTNKKNITAAAILPTISLNNDSTELKFSDEFKSRADERKQDSKFSNSNNNAKYSKPEPVYNSFFEDFFDYDTSFKPMPTTAPTEPVFLPTVLPSFTYLPNITSSRKPNLSIYETTETPKQETTTKEIETKSFRFRPQISKELIFKSMNRSIDLQSEKLKNKNIISKLNVTNTKREILPQKPCIKFDCNKNTTQIGKKYKRMHFKKFWKNNGNNSIVTKNIESNESLKPSNNLTLKFERKTVKAQRKPANEDIIDSLNDETETEPTITTTIRPLGRHKTKLNIRNESNYTSSSTTYRTRRVKDYSVRGNINYQNKNLKQESEIKKRNETKTSDMKRSRKHQRRKIDTSTISSTLQNSNLSFIQNRQLNEDNLMPIESLFNFNVNGSTTSTTSTTTTTTATTPISYTTRRHIRHFESSTTESAIMKIAKDKSGGRRSNRRNRKYQKPAYIEDRNDTIEKNKEIVVKNNVISWDSINYNKLTTNQPVLPIEIYFKN